LGRMTPVGRQDPFAVPERDLRQHRITNHSKAMTAVAAR